MHMDMRVPWLLLLCVVRAAAVGECPAGQYYYDLKCKSCDRGQYKPSWGQGGCTPCPPGTWGGDYNGLVTCPLCVAGKYTDYAGAWNCGFCDAGTTSGSGVTSCTPCESGTYRATNGVAPCDKCWYNPNNVVECTKCSKMAECPSCAAGTWSSAGATACTPLPPSTSIEWTSTSTPLPTSTSIAGTSTTSTPVPTSETSTPVPTSSGTPVRTSTPGPEKRDVKGDNMIVIIGVVVGVVVLFGGGVVSYMLCFR